MVILARESRGITQQELAKRIGLSQAAISKAEKLEGKVSSTMLAQLAATLNFPEGFFYQHSSRYPPATPLHRKKQSLSQRVINKIEAEANVKRLHVEKLLDSIDLPDKGYPNFVNEIDSPPEAAIATRQHLRLPRGPIANLTRLIEWMGIVVLPCNFDTNKLDGFTITSKAAPIIFFNKNMPWCRIRFTLAHELGHIVLGHLPRQGVEEEANKFAAELLMPTEDIGRDFSGETVDFRLLAMLKPRWKVSMQALLYRAKELRYINDMQNKRIWMQFNVLGYKTREPAHLDVAPEEPMLFKKMIELHYTDLEYTQDELMDMLLSTKSSFFELYPFEINKEKKKAAQIIQLFNR